MIEFLIEAQNQSLARRGRFVVAFSDPSLITILDYRIINDPAFSWSDWEVFYVSDNVISAESPLSVHQQYQNLLWSKVPIPSEQVHPVIVPHDFNAAQPGHYIDAISEAYERTILTVFGVELYEKPPAFDLILLGLNADGSCGGVSYTNHPITEETDWLVASCTDSPPPFASRVTMTLPLINAARRLAFVVTEDATAAALATVMDLGMECNLPAAKVALPYRPIVWFSTDTAARHVLQPRSTFWDIDG